MNNLPQKIRRLRQLQNLSQKDMANRLCISPRAYGKIEAGEISLTVERFGQIAEALGCPPDAILIHSPEKVYMRFLYKGE
jgi:transcriptional regulator with XRE-family HTH domain